MMRSNLSKENFEPPETSEVRVAVHCKFLPKKAGYYQNGGALFHAYFPNHPTTPALKPANNNEH
jgi:hypothetical protein